MAIDVNDSDPISVGASKLDTIDEPSSDGPSQKTAERGSSNKAPAKDDKYARFRKANLKCRERFKLRR